MDDLEPIMRLVLKILLLSFPVLFLFFTLHLLLVGEFLAVLLWAMILGFNYWLYKRFGFAD